MTEGTCGECVFFDLIVVHDSDTEPDEMAVPSTICRRHPPQDGWPVVLADDWCGEWRIRRSAP